jgi:predicted MFS family arabinose efflux permease
VVAGLLFTSLGAVAMGLAPGPWLLFGGRTFTGVAAATWVTSSVLFASYFPPERAARGIGVISFINSAAIVTATSVGGQLAEAWGPESAFFIAAPLGALGALLLIPLAEPPVTRARAFSYDTFLRVVAHPVVLTASALSILMHFASTATIFSFTLVYADRLGASSSDLGLISGAYLGSSTLATLGAVYLIERRGYSFTILLGGVVMGVSLLATPLFTALPPFVGLQIAIGAGSGLASTALMALSITAVPPAHRAMAMGAYQAIYSLGMLTGPILGGVLAEGPGLESVFYMAGSAALLAGALAFARKLPRR